MVVLEALAHLDNPDIQCVFTGDTQDHRWPEYFEQIKTFIQENNLSSSVHLLGHISRQQQIQLLQAATAVIQPSRFEGWSTVVEESKALNKRLILSEFPVHREQAPENSLFFEPGDYQALSQSMKTLWESRSTLESISGHYRETHQQYILQCARQFVSLAHMASRNFDPARHDPNRLILHYLNRMQQQEQDETGQKVVQWTLDKTIGRLRRESIDRTFHFDETCRRFYPGFHSIAAKKIFAAVLAKRTAHELWNWLNQAGKLAEPRRKFSLRRIFDSLRSRNSE